MKRQAFLAAIRRMGFKLERKRIDSTGHEVLVYTTYKNPRVGYIPIVLYSKSKPRGGEDRVVLAERLDIHHDSKVNAYYQSEEKQHRSKFFFDKLARIKAEDY